MKNFLIKFIAEHTQPITLTFKVFSIIHYMYVQVKNKDENYPKEQKSINLNKFQRDSTKIKKNVYSLSQIGIKELHIRLSAENH